MKTQRSKSQVFIALSIMVALLVWATLALADHHDGPGGYAHHDHDAGHNGHDQEGHDEHGEAGHEEHAEHDHDAGYATCPKALVLKQLPAALSAVDKAAKAIKFGDKRTALKELDRLRQLLANVQRDLQVPALAKAPAICINQACPIMGKPIDPAKVKPELTRPFHGKTVGFCCPPCLDKWDALNALDKAAKLKPTVAASVAECAAHGDHSEHGHDH